MGLVAYCVAITLETPPAQRAVGAIILGVAIGAGPGHGQRRAGHRARGAVDRRDARHAEHLPRHRLPDRRQPPGAAGGPAARVHGAGARHHHGHADLRRRRHRGRGHRDARSCAGPGSAGRSTRSGATRRPRRSSASRPAASCSRVHAVRAAARASPASCGSSSSGRSTARPRTASSLAVVAAVVVGGVNIFGGSGTVIGAAIGAYFLGFVANALILVGPVAVLAPGDLRRRDPRRGQRRRPHRAPHPAPGRREPSPMTATAGSAGRTWRVARRHSRAGRRCCSSSSSR